MGIQHIGKPAEFQSFFEIKGKFTELTEIKSKSISLRSFSQPNFALLSRFVSISHIIYTNLKNNIIKRLFVFFTGSCELRSLKTLKILM